MYNINVFSIDLILIVGLYTCDALLIYIIFMVHCFNIIMCLNKKPIIQ